jgi:hypothetical protein
MTGGHRNSAVVRSEATETKRPPTRTTRSSPTRRGLGSRAEQPDQLRTRTWRPPRLQQRHHPACPVRDRPDCRLPGQRQLDHPAVHHWCLRLIHPLPARHGPTLAARTDRRHSEQLPNEDPRAQAIDAIGATFTAIVLIIVLITKFTHGAWIVTIAMPLLFVTMQGIRRHYDRVAAEIAPTPAGVSLPSRIHAIVPVSRLLLPTLQALAFARATHPSTLTAVTVQVDEQETQALADEWRAQEIPVELKVLNSPYREVSTPILDYIRDIRRDSPRDAVCVFIPEYVVGHWWEQLLHNQSALRRRDPQSDLLHQRHRVHQRPLPAGRAGPRPLPQRTSRAEMSLPHHPIARPNRQWQGMMGHEVEAGPQRVRSHIRGPYPNKMITDQIRSTVYLIDPFAGPQGEARVRCAPLSLDSVG